MTDKTIGEVENEEVETTEQKSTAEKQDKTPKTFTQEELDRTVQARLRREKEANKSLVDSLNSELEVLREAHNATMEVQISDWEEGWKAYFATLTPKEQIEFLKDDEKMGKVRRKNIPPKTPTEKGQEHTGFRHSISRI